MSIFPKQCSLIQNRSTIPSVFTPSTNKSLSPFQFKVSDIYSIIKKLDPNKAHGHGMISICLLVLVL